MNKEGNVIYSTFITFKFLGKQKSILLRHCHGVLSDDLLDQL